ncbi:MAG: SCO family protein [Armatimonadetes bacterium]|nr:SCO family protein [Armatimonadota bacterium]
MPILRTLLASLLVLTAGLTTFSYATNGFRAYTSESARRIEVREHPRKVPDVLLVTADASRTSFASLRGRWLLVEFIYTGCASYCALQGDDFSRLQDRLKGPLARRKVELVSISFDLKQDGPDRLAGYQKRFGDRGVGWLAARPLDQKGLAKLMRVFGVTAVPDGAGGFVHNAAIAIVDPQGRLVAIVNWNDLNAAEQYVTHRLTT